MPKFILTYHGGNKPETPEEGKKHFQEYQAWLGSLGDAAISPMNPMGQRKTLTKDGVSEGGLEGQSGFTILEASDMNAALEMAKACPFLDIEGTLVVAEIMQMG
ncbi:MAG: hypothetical protein HKN88_05530 [Gammaproteobacteria bacterium]|nr:YciI family protein [Gammaproteobacteria bacterium]NNC97515.1 hypothetical protein [Gammaproteobacteria bacterium]NNM14231.1 hypothetical protein [Gammaproteobacteria bacterium]